MSLFLIDWSVVGGSFVSVVTLVFFFFISVHLLFWLLSPSIHSFPSSPWSLSLFFIPSSEIHPSVWAPCSLHPLHRNDCNSGCGLVLVVGAGVPEGKVREELVSIWCVMPRMVLTHRSRSVSSPKLHEDVVSHICYQATLVDLVLHDQVLRWKNKRIK